MSRREETLEWLAQFQAEFSDNLRLPLDRSKNSLRAPTERYAQRLVDSIESGPRTPARERLAVYNRQYWFRLFGVLQHEFRLSARLLGFWHFNDFASRFLSAHPPRHQDIQRAGEGFCEFMVSELADSERVAIPPFGQLPGLALLEAVRIDDAFRRVLSVPMSAPWSPRREEASELPRARLLAAPRWALISEHWELISLRNQLAGEDERPLALPAESEQERHWLILSEERGHGAFPLPAIHARLLAALREKPVGEALAHTEQAATDDERATLLQSAQAWLADSVRRGLWTGSILPSAGGQEA